MKAEAQQDHNTQYATSRDWIALAVIALPCMVYAMDLTVLNLALPAISTELAPTPSQLLWIVDSYGFMVAAFLITMGTLGDRIGRKRLLLWGAAGFAVVSIVASLVRDTQMLIVMRALLGIAGATLAPSTLSLIRNMFVNPRQRQFAIGIWIASFSAGSALGPLMGGLVLQAFHWSAIFLLAVPVMVLLLVLGPVLLREYRDPNAGQIDLASVGLSIVAILMMVQAVKLSAESGPGIVATVLLIIGAGLGVVFLRRQKLLVYPLLDLALLRLPRYRAAVTAYGLSCLAMFGTYIYITQFLQLVLGLSPLKAGMATVPWSLAFIVGSLFAGKVTETFGASRVIVGGLAIAASSFLLLAWAAGAERLWLLVLATMIMSMGLAPVFTVCNEIIVTSAPAERAGAASALSETCAELSGALGIALLGSLGTYVYRLLLNLILPTDLDNGVATAASGSLAAAKAAAQSLPAGLGQVVGDSAQHAFLFAMQSVCWAGCLILVLACLKSARALRA